MDDLAPGLRPLPAPGFAPVPRRLAIALATACLPACLAACLAACLWGLAAPSAVAQDCPALIADSNKAWAGLRESYAAIREKAVALKDDEAKGFALFCAWLPTVLPVLESVLEKKTRIDQSCFGVPNPPQPGLACDTVCVRGMLDEFRRNAAACEAAGTPPAPRR
jgi:hypothetical protein